MKMLSFPTTVTDWTLIDATLHPGDSGIATWKTQSFDDIRVRMVDYSAGYTADHWCSKGHVILCLSGELDIDLGDGASLRLLAGQSCCVGDGDPPHRTSSARGARLFIVD